MNVEKCPVCDWKIEKAVEVPTAGGVVKVCCEECAQTLRDKAAKQPASRGSRG